MDVSVYTDGGSSGNPGPSGWAAIILSQEGPIAELSGGSRCSTNNRMELAAAIKALEYLKSLPQVETITIHTDSQYLRNGITSWVERWQRNGWKTSQKKSVLNQDLWQWLVRLTKQLSPQWQWVKGHAGNPYNERCDKLVAVERKKWAVKANS